MNLRQIYWLMQVSSWLLIAMMASKYTIEEDATYDLLFQYFTAVFIFGLFATHTYKLFVDKYQPEDSSVQTFLLFPLIGNIILGFLFFVLDIKFTSSEILKSNYNTFGDYFGLFVDDIWVTTPWFFFFHILRYVTQKQTMNEKMISMEKMLIKSELDALKTQLHPHFFFNALNSIKALMVIDHHEAREAVDQLSDLLRLSLNIGESQTVRVEEELKLTKAYLFLEKIRFDKRLMYYFDIDEKLINKMIIPISLSTLIENAIKHGIAKLKNGGEVKVRIFEEDENLMMQVINTGNLVMQDNVKRQDGSGIGLVNLKKRLELQYTGEASLKIEEIEDKVVSTIMIPLARTW
ncbi:histidine kinase [Arcicella sp. DC2W]|uniref:Histidine kinase n=1 Tax=Arcicella gelida TaxID=2984195 RepID=A0ABU5S7M9_9BACT|nr:histidine kinase [Arcicella sp. DC2W]MEA5404466.1 histidine kinase [Arcicella sp. DC2W]